MGMASENLLVTLQILPGFFSNCLFLALYDSVVLVRRLVSLLCCPTSAAGGSGKWRPMLTSAGLRSVWNSFLLDAYKQVQRTGNSFPIHPIYIKVHSSTCSHKAAGMHVWSHCDLSYLLLLLLLLSLLLLEQ